MDFGFHGAWSVHLHNHAPRMISMKLFQVELLGEEGGDLRNGLTTWRTIMVSATASMTRLPAARSSDANSLDDGMLP